MKTKIYQKWISAFAVTAVTVLIIIGVVNFLVDPMFMFREKKNIYDEIFRINWRLQKTNYLRFVNSDFGSFMLGSSHVYMIRNNDMSDKNFFNYWVPGLHAKEYLLNMSFLPKEKPLRIYLGLDFFGTNENWDYPEKFLPLGSKMDIFSLSMLRYSVKILFSKPNKETDKSDISDMKQIAKDRVSGLLYKYLFNESFGEIILNLRNEYPQHKFIVFLTSETNEYMREAYINRGLLNSYLRWIRETVQVFGEVWNFNYVNSVTSNLDYWDDSDHMNKHGFHFMAQRISGGADCPEDFGILVTKENLEEHIKFLRKNILESLSSDINSRQ